MTSWKRVSLGDVCRIQAGGTPKRSVPEYFNGSIPWVKIGDMLQGEIVDTEEKISDRAVHESAAKIFPAGTVLISIFATIGRTATLGVEAATNQAIAGVIPKNPTRLSPLYLRRYLDSVVAELKRKASGVAQVNINSGILKALEIPLPSMAEQKRIAAVLDQVDSLRAKRLKAIALLDELTRSTFLDMFGDPSHNPRKWRQEKIGSLLLVKPGYGTMIPATEQKSGHLCIRVANIQNWSLDLSSRKYVTLPPDDGERHEVATGDLLMARAIATQEHLGKAIVAEPGNEKWAFDSHILRLRFNPMKANPYYVQALLATPGGRSVFLGATRRSSVQYNINSKEISALEIPVPPIAEQEKFRAALTGVDRARKTHYTHLGVLDELFASLQQRAFSGTLWDYEAAA
ncbi:restriction endonuclease subunit S [Streptomyces sp. NPDC051315]|uniref:restriction endonuclease subunit S n=1 Tax=Streptomyces sp. NPDC051315 TaxID=3365650 RepID=UPI0037AD3973